MVASADQLATSAGLEIFAQGGNAVDAAIATNAAIAVTGPHLCGIGGDLFALVHIDDPGSDDATGETFASTPPAGPAPEPTQRRSRAEGLAEMPFKLDIRSVTVPGCVDGWMALHERFGSLPLDVILAPARRLAGRGFPGQPTAGRDRSAGSTPPAARTSRAGRAGAADGAGRSAARRSPGTGSNRRQSGATASTAASSARACWNSVPGCSAPTISAPCRPIGSTR